MIVKNKKEHYTLMFFPEGRGDPFSMRIHRGTLKLMIVALFMFILGGAYLIYKSGDIGLRLQLLHVLKEENNRLKADNASLQISAERIASIESLTVYLHRIAVVPELSNAQMSAGPQKVTPTARRTEAEETTPRRTAAEAAEAQRNSLPAVTSEQHYSASIPSILPVNGWITRHFSTDKESFHLATDFAAASGTPIRATAMGVVEDVRNDKDFGLMVEVRHEHGFVTRYGHCSQVLVSVRDRVNRGQTIALVGNTGRSTAPHLHYEVLKDGKPVNPMDYAAGGHKK